MLRFLLISGLFAAYGSGVGAAGADGDFVVRGFGGQSCASFNNALQGEDAQLTRVRLSDWVAGWLSHANRVTKGAYDVHPISDNAAISEIVRRICIGNPVASIETVLHSSVEAVKAGIQEESSDLIAAQVEGREVQIHAGVMKAFQDVLVEANYLEAQHADGKFGPATRKAIEEFQKVSKVNVSGLPDPLTVYLVFLNQ